MITCNLWTGKGLVNGTQGVVHKIVYAPGADPVLDLPAYVLVKVDPKDYTGPTEPEWIVDGHPCIPVVPVRAVWEKGDRTLTRTQLPLTLAWAITIHKSQGLTLLKAVIGLGEKDFAQGLSFVGISRVKTLSGLAFMTRFPKSRLEKPKTAGMVLLKKEMLRINSLGFDLDTYDMDLSMYDL